MIWLDPPLLMDGDGLHVPGVAVEAGALLGIELKSASSLVAHSVSLLITVPVVGLGRLQRAGSCFRSLSSAGCRRGVSTGFEPSLRRVQPPS